ncbi:LamB/YcsF family protein [Streptomyces sp. NPDC054802]
MHASARSRRASPSSAAGPWAGRGAAPSWGGTVSVGAGEVTEHRLGPRTDNGRNGPRADPALTCRPGPGPARFGVVTARCGRSVGVRARSLCLHGDTLGAVAPARRVRFVPEGR